MTYYGSFTSDVSREQLDKTLADLNYAIPQRVKQDLVILQQQIRTLTIRIAPFCKLI